MTSTASASCIHTVLHKRSALYRANGKYHVKLNEGQSVTPLRYGSQDSETPLNPQWLMQQLISLLISLFLHALIP